VPKTAPHPLEDGDVHALWSIGFRPFFLGASVAAVLLVPTWLTLLELGLTAPYFSGAQFHAHEMLHGYAAAVVAGFLLTAASNWTSRRVASGRLLQALFALWLAGRLAVLTPGLPRPLVAAVDHAFYPALALVLGRALVAARSRRNYVMLALLAVLFLSSLSAHLEAGLLPGLTPPQKLGQELGLRAVSLMMLIVGGRVVPMFTRNATGKTWIGAHPVLERVALGTFLLAALAAPVLEPGAAGVLWLVAGLAGLVRMVPWGSWTARAPLLWILHVGAAAVPLSLLAEGLAELGAAPVTTGLHLLTVGAIGCLTLGMMTRVSLGHSGRMLVAPPSMTFAFALLVLAAGVRALLPWVAPELARLSWLVAGGAWTLAFGLLLAFGLRIWASPRVA
jgi:uncharacterized protein involved in response to NO